MVTATAQTTAMIWVVSTRTPPMCRRPPGTVPGGKPRGAAPVARLATSRRAIHSATLVMIVPSSCSPPRERSGWKATWSTMTAVSAPPAMPATQATANGSPSSATAQ